MLFLAISCFLTTVFTSSHSEAPGTARGPGTDLSDFYMFLTRRGTLALVMNIAGLSQSQSGPNYTPTNNDFVYQIHIDNDGDAHEDITFQFITGYRYVNGGRGIEVTTPQGAKVPLPIGHVAGAFGPITFNATSGLTSGLNTQEYYRVRVLKGEDYTEAIENGPFASRLFNGQNVYEFNKAYQNAGTKSFGENDPLGTGDTSQYDTYVNGSSIYKKCENSRLQSRCEFFVGPRREAFGIALGEVFDAINIDAAPVFELGLRSTLFKSGAEFYDGNSLDRMAVISFVIEIPLQCVQNKYAGDVLGGWTSVRKLDHRRNAANGEETHHTGQQHTRLGNPLVNELLIGTTFKNEWNSRHPSGDARYNEFLLSPVVPAYIEALFSAAGVHAPTFSRVDLLAILHSGIPGLNLPLNQAYENYVFGNNDQNDDDDDDDDDTSNSESAPGVIYADILRLNVTLGKWVDCTAQKTLGVIAGDAAGYPNGRRVGDDIVDITLRAAMGVLCATPSSAATYCGGSSNIAVSGNLSYTDQAPVRACMFKCTVDDFPFLNTPIPGNKMFQPLNGYTTSQFVKGCAAGGVVPTNQADLNALIAIFKQ